MRWRLEACHAAIALTRARGDALALATHLAAAAFLAQAHGAYRSARDLAAEAIGLAEQQRNVHAYVTGQFHHVWAMAYLGESETALADVDEALQLLARNRDHPGATYFQLHAALLYEQIGDFARVRTAASLSRCEAPVTAWRIHAGAARILARDDPAEAARLRESASGAVHQLAASLDSAPVLRAVWLAREDVRSVCRQSDPHTAPARGAAGGSPSERCGPSARLAPMAGSGSRRRRPGRGSGRR